MKSSIIVVFITFFLILLLDLFFGAKIINHLFSNEYVIKNPIYHHDLTKNLNKKITYNNISTYQICTDHYGFKSECNNDHKISKLIDYAFIGDSFTEGVGLNYEDTFVGKFKKKKKINSIVNLGVSSYSPKIYFKKIEYLLNEGFTFNKVIIFIDVGDILDENSYYIKDDSTVGNKSQLNTIYTVYEDFNSFYKIKKVLKSYLPITFIAYTQIQKLNLNLFKNKKSNFGNIKKQDDSLINSRWTYENDFSDKDKKWIEKGKNDSINFVDKLFELSKTKNFKISLAIYPWPAQILFDEDTGRSTLGKFWGDYCENKCENFINYLEIFHEIKKKMNKEKIIETYYIKNDVHFNKFGNDLIYQKLIEIF